MSDLSGIKAGDFVTEIRRGEPTVIAEVTRVTATLIVSGLNKWRCKDGYVPGATGYDRPHIEPTTEKHRATIRRANRVVTIRYAKGDVWEKLTDEQLEMVIGWIK